MKSGIGFSEDEEDETVAESLAIEQASAPSGGEPRKPHDGDVRQCGGGKVGLSDAPARMKLLNPKLDQRMNLYPIEVSLPRWLHWIRNAVPAR